MSDAQQRLAAKQTIIDIWNLNELLCLVGAVRTSGEQNWVSVSRLMKHHCPAAPTTDWYNQKNCALQYNALLEKYAPNIPKRKRGDDQANGEGGGNTDTVADIIYSIISKKRIEELIRETEKSKAILMKLSQDMDSLDDEDLSESEFERIAAEEEMDRQKDEEERLEHERFLAERERKKKELEDSWKKNTSTNKLQIATGNSVSTKRAKSSAAAISNEGEKEKTQSLASPKKTEQLEENHSGDVSGDKNTSPLLTTLLQSSNSENLHSVAKPSSTPLVENATVSKEIKPESTSDTLILSEEDKKEEPLSESTLSKNVLESESNLEPDVPSVINENCNNAEPSVKEEVHVDTDENKPEDKEVEPDKIKTEDNDEEQAVKEETTSVQASTVATTRRSSRSSGSAQRTTRGSSSKVPEEVEEDENKKPELPPPTSSQGVRESMRNKKLSERSEDIEAEEVTTPSTARPSRSRRFRDDEIDNSLPENRRVIRLRGSSGSEFDSSSGRARRGSGATSRSSSPTTESEDTTKGDSETEAPASTSKTRSFRLRQRSGKPAPASAAVVDEDSNPNSPASQDSFLDLHNPDKSIWKTQSQSLCDFMNKHQYSNTFTSKGAATNDTNSHYNSVVKCRTDLNAIKKNVDLGAVKNVHELQRDFLLMLLNATVYYDLDDIMPLRHDMAVPKRQEGVRKRTETVGYKTSTYAKDVNHEFQTYKNLTSKVSGTSYAPRPSRSSTTSGRKQLEANSRKRGSNVVESPSGGPSNKKRRK